MSTLTFTDHGADDLLGSDEVDRYNCGLIDEDILYRILISPEWAQIVNRLREGWRPIGRQRARKLRRRGEVVQYLPEYCSQAWLAPHLK